MSRPQPPTAPPLTPLTLPPIAPSHQATASLPSLPEILSQLRGDRTPTIASVPVTRSNSFVSDDALVAAVSLSRLSGGPAPAPASAQARNPKARFAQTHQQIPIQPTTPNHSNPPSSSFPQQQQDSSHFPLSSPQLDPSRLKTIMSWLDQYGLNQIPAEVAAEPEWAASVLGSASAAELAQAQAELDMWSTMAFNGDDPFGSNQQGPPKEVSLPGLASLPWGEAHDEIFAKDSHHHTAHSHAHDLVHNSPLSIFSSLAHSAPPTTSAFHSAATVSPPETHSTSHSAANSPPTSRPTTGRKRSLSQANLHAPPSPLPSDTGSGSGSNSGLNEGEKREGEVERTGPLSEVDKRKRNTEASARFRAKKKAREAQLRQDTSVLAERVANLEKIADSVSAPPVFDPGERQAPIG